MRRSFGVLLPVIGSVPEIVGSRVHCGLCLPVLLISSIVGSLNFHHQTSRLVVASLARLA